MLIAEVGLNHLGDEELALRYVNYLSKTSVDAISFQVREAEYYQRSEKKKFKLSNEVYREAARIIHENKKKFGVALADIEMVDFFESLGANFYKVIRNDITDLQLIKQLEQTKKRVIVSTGQSSDKDIDNFLNYLKENFNDDYHNNFVLNHTQLSYDVEDCNLKSIESLREKYNLDVSFGSHCSLPEVLFMSVYSNPSDILFYVKFSDGQKYPDDRHAIEAEEVSYFTNTIKELYKGIGDGVKIKMINKIEETKI